MPQLRPGVVSVILVNFRGATDTIGAIEQLRALDWPAERLEIVVVENASGDDSAQRINAAAPDIVFVQSKENLGFAGGCNLGVAKSSGEFVAFLNNDARPDKAWISAAIDRFAESPRVGAVASKVLDWDGVNVDYIGSALTWFGMGYKPFTAEKLEPGMPEPGDVLFGTGAAMFVRREVFAELGGFDERYFMFFEDVDFGWRLNLRGWRYVYEAGSLAFHKHHASMTSFGEFKESYLLERNALFTLYKNLEPDTLNDALPAAMALAVRRGMAKGAVDSTSFDLRKPGGDGEESLQIAKAALTGVFGIDQFVEHLPSLRASRDEIQSSRTVSDARLWRLFGLTDMPAFQDESYLAGYENIVSAFDVIEAPAATRVLIITGDPIGKKMAGPAIRAWNMAQALASESSVTLLSLTGVESVSAPFDVVHVRPGDDRAFAPFERDADVIIFQGHAMSVFEVLRTTKKILVVDIYDPMHLEQLEQARELPAAVWEKQVSDATGVLNEQLARGDFFLCASERQRHFYLGQLAALGRINPANYAADPDLTDLISVVPFGFDATAPAHKKAVLKGVRPGIGADDKVLLWSGGLYNWFDPKTLIRAVAELAERRPEVKLFFQGTKHPHPGVPEMQIVADSRALARELGTLDNSVFFNDSWVDYSERENYLMEADAGVSTHFSHIETTFSFRTRILDYLWAGLPMVITEGDHFAELVARESLGIAVEAGNVAGLTAALEKILFDEDFIRQSRENIARVREQYRWDNVLEPLVTFVASPHSAADRAVGSRSDAPRRGRPRQRIKRSGWRHDLGLVKFYLQNGGPKTVVRKIRSRLRKR
ncbi:hypothetical protein B0I08_103106 [Glaciihabitans tibetensis]|uniref:Glycosyltransferase 2-like domain-containing protein n=1 Tax=Glaciihabitans tibetensis TaxID=1266600 RepID=A0A2T0VFD6_9MICO|nr:glycosyltransferase [Glaciihabitans tibetensis]PRY68901.1 hypothetical protein B0I08_103106 [Glaciihabitans tibetensis]